MAVKPRTARASQPGYPSRREHLERRALLGALAVGAATIAAGCVGHRTRGVMVGDAYAAGGVPAMEPRADIIATDSPQQETVTTGGVIAVEPAGDPETAAQTTYVVRKGDTMYALARRFLGDGGRWPEIVALNPGLTPERLHVGLTLRMPTAP